MDISSLDSRLATLQLSRRPFGNDAARRVQQQFVGLGFVRRSLPEPVCRRESTRIPDPGLGESIAHSETTMKWVAPVAVGTASFSGVILLMLLAANGVLEAVGLQQLLMPTRVFLVAPGILACLVAWLAERESQLFTVDRALLILSFALVGTLSAIALGGPIVCNLQPNC